MNRLRNESGDSGPESGALQASPFLHRKGILSQGGGAWAEVVCVDALGEALYLAPIPHRGAGDLTFESPASFRLLTAGGLLVATGTLAAPGTQVGSHLTRQALALVVPPGGVERVNRREFYRVSLSLNGKVVFGPAAAPAVGAPRSGLPNLEALGKALAAPARPCAVKDLSLGGARIAVGPPAPRAGERAFLQVATAVAEVLGPLPAFVIQAQPGAHPAPADVSVRLRFDRLPTALEGRLNRYLTQVQRDQLRTGVRG